MKLNTITTKRSQGTRPIGLVRAIFSLFAYVVQLIKCARSIEFVRILVQVKFVMAFVLSGLLIVGVPIAPAQAQGLQGGHQFYGAWPNRQASGTAMIPGTIWQGACYPGRRAPTSKVERRINDKRKELEDLIKYGIKLCTSEEYETVVLNDAENPTNFMGMLRDKGQASRYFNSKLGSNVINKIKAGPLKCVTTDDNEDERPKRETLYDCDLNDDYKFKCTEFDQGYDGDDDWSDVEDIVNELDEIEPIGAQASLSNRSIGRGLASTSASASASASSSTSASVSEQRASVQGASTVAALVQMASQISYNQTPVNEKAELISLSKNLEQKQSYEIAARTLKNPMGLDAVDAKRGYNAGQRAALVAKTRDAMGAQHGYGAGDYNLAQMAKRLGRWPAQADSEQDKITKKQQRQIRKLFNPKIYQMLRAGYLGGQDTDGDDRGEAFVNIFKKLHRSTADFTVTDAWKSSGNESSKNCKKIQAIKTHVENLGADADNSGLKKLLSSQELNCSGDPVSIKQLMNDGGNPTKICYEPSVYHDALFNTKDAKNCKLNDDGTLNSETATRCVKRMDGLIKACQKALDPSAVWQSGDGTQQGDTESAESPEPGGGDAGRDPASNNCQHPCSIIRDAIDELAEDINDQIVEFNEKCEENPNHKQCRAQYQTEAGQVCLSCQNKVKWHDRVLSMLPGLAGAAGSYFVGRQVVKNNTRMGWPTHPYTAYGMGFPFLMHAMYGAATGGITRGSHCGPGGLNGGFGPGGWPGLYGGFNSFGGYPFGLMGSPMIGPHFAPGMGPWGLNGMLNPFGGFNPYGGFGGGGFPGGFPGGFGGGPGFGFNLGFPGMGGPFGGFPGGFGGGPFGPGMGGGFFPGMGGFPGGMGILPGPYSGGGFGPFGGMGGPFGGFGGGPFGGGPFGGGPFGGFGGGPFGGGFGGGINPALMQQQQMQMQMYMQQLQAQQRMQQQRMAMMQRYYQEQQRKGAVVGSLYQQMNQIQMQIQRVLSSGVGGFGPGFGGGFGGSFGGGFGGGGAQRILPYPGNQNTTNDGGTENLR